MRRAGPPTLPKELISTYISNRGLAFWNWLEDERGFSKEVIEEFELGYAPNRPMFNVWPSNVENLPRYPRSPGDTVYQNQYQLPGKMASGAAKGGQDTGASVAIPIKDSNGLLRGFAARSISLQRSGKDIGGAKYRRWASALPPYGASNYKKLGDKVILVEGYSDLWRLWEAGVYNALAIYGLSGLKSFASSGSHLGAIEFTSIVDNKEIWLFMDGDLPGRTATVRHILLLKKAIEAGIINVTNVYVVIGPPEKDPGDLSIQEIQSLLDSKPMLGEEYIRWWLSMGIDVADITQVSLLNKQIDRLFMNNL